MKTEKAGFFTKATTENHKPGFDIQKTNDLSKI